jgi:predicted small lipoprotein YifL
MILSTNRSARTASAWLLFIVMATNLSGCGIRGPLVLPEPDRAAPAQPAANTAAAN